MRDYLDLAIFEYEKAGGKYEMSVREKRAAAFDKDIYDGTQWELVIEYENRRNRTYEGSNKFPSNFDELLEVMEFVMK